MNRRRVFAFFFATFSLSIAAVASATTMRALTVSDLATEADLVIRGRVLSTSDVMTVIDGALSPRLVTRVEVLETIAGDSGSNVVLLVERGGRDRSFFVQREGIAELRRGQETLLFLRRTAEGHRPVGHAQGAFVVGRDARSGAARIRRSADPGVLIGDVTEKGLDLGANPALGDVLAVVREARGGAR